jgi:hypothetical protein
VQAGNDNLDVTIVMRCLDEAAAIGARINLRQASGFGLAFDVSHGANTDKARWMKSTYGLIRTLT